MELNKILSFFAPSVKSEGVTITQLKRIEDNEPYQVWKIDTDSGSFILKEAKEYEAEVYQTILTEVNGNTPALYQTAIIDGKTYLLMEYVQGSDLCKCNRRKLTLALDALIFLQKTTWESRAYADCAYSFDKSLGDRRKRGKYLNGTELEAAYEKFLEVYTAVPRTLCHDDLLQFNIIASDDRAVLIDWEYGGILPYPTSFARLIAHGEDTEDALFYMTQDDRKFSVEYYYNNLLKGMGISYADWLKTLEYFLFYEYCEWISLGNKYGNTDNEYYKKYLPIAKQQAQKILETENRGASFYRS